MAGHRTRVGRGSAARHAFISTLVCFASAQPYTLHIAIPSCIQLSSLCLSKERFVALRSYLPRQ